MSDLTSPMVSRVSVRAVLCGAVVALAVLTVLLILGGVFGLSALAPRALERVGFSAWLLVSLGLSTFAGGWVAAAAGRAPVRRDGLLHGLVTWAVLVLVGVAAFLTYGLSPRANDQSAYLLFFLAHVLPLVTALLGGRVGAWSEARWMVRPISIRHERDLRIPPGAPTVHQTT